MTLRIIFALLIPLLTVPIAAEAITLDEAMGMALEAETARSALYESDAIKADARTRTAFALPQVSISGSYAKMDTNAEESAFVQFPDETYSARVQGSQVLFAGGRIINSHKLKSALVRRAALTEQERLRDIRREVRLAFYGVLYRKALLGILEDRVSQREDELGDATALREVGMVTSLDVRQAKLLLNTALDGLKAQEAEYEASLIGFNLALGRSGGGELLVPEGELKRAAGLPDLLDAARASLEEERLLALRSAANELSASRYEKRLATGEFLPELVLFGTGETVDGGVFQEGESWTAGVELRWNLVDGGLKLAKRKAAAANLKLAEESLSLTGKGLAGEVREMEVRAQSLDERIALQEEALVLSEENYEDARAHYRAGTITQTRLGDFSLAYAEARFGLKNLYYLERQLLSELQALLEGS